MIARLESWPALRRRLPVMVNDLAVVRGERLVVPWQPHATERGRDTPFEMSVRHSPPVRMIMQAARSPVPVGDLLDKLGAQTPDAAVSAIDAMVAELVARGVLITSLRPPSTSADGLAHVLDRLQEVDAAAVPEAAPVVGELRVIHSQLQAADRTARWVDGRTRRAVATRMRALSTAPAQPLMVNLRLGAAMVLPPQVATEAEWAASALLRLSPAPLGNPEWREYHTSFLNRYGPALWSRSNSSLMPQRGSGFPATTSSWGDRPQPRGCRGARSAC